MAELTLNINQWLCGNHRDNHEGAKIGINHFGNSEGKLLKTSYPASKEHSMCCIGQFLHQAGIKEKTLCGFEQPSDFNHNDDAEVFVPDYNKEITDILFQIDDNHVVDTRVSEDLMEINDDDSTTVFYKIKAIREKLEDYGHTLKIEDPKGELDTLREMVMESTKV